jgi:RNA polymerase sigma factor FliA
MPASVLPTATRRRSTPARSAATRRPAPTVRVDRDALLESHVGLVHHVARQIVRRIGDAVALDELVSAGTLGLLQAADSFDAARGLSFSTHAVPRIRGAILDELRKLDGAPRNLRRRTRELARARDVTANVLLRAPSADEVAHVMNVPTEAVHRWEADAHATVACALDQTVRGEHGDATATLAETLADDETTGIEDILTREVEVRRLAEAIATLREQERTVLGLSYFEELKLQEIAQVLGVSVCRVSQIRTAALARLRVALSDLRAA